MMALQGQVTKMNKLQQSRALAQVNVARNSIQKVQKVADVGCVECGGTQTTDACPLNTKTSPMSTTTATQTCKFILKRSELVKMDKMNNNVRNKEVESTRREEPRKEVSNQAMGSNPLPPSSYPSRLKKKSDDQQFAKFLDVLKQLHTYIPFVDALEKIPSNVKFLKDILAKKRRMNDCETVALTQTTSDVFKNGIIEKMKDS
ncbi:hypothetical protein E5676_scaffold2750G00210 [Cucumis melo var. makuwa]|uniref:Uncharacterized protein n=1 Tax=Cucumis melo var. makuwa TaxID=1194695 RepID=A0A5D3BCH3_CUCMM|nr:hypothetical protein E6C27_scaffold24G001460 [Cucumis melo var. makuwa]TYJ96827.1 hypothetical protein E5676_scaffold2750G00210 [Cucumis melo var. makuwa]